MRIHIVDTLAEEHLVDSLARALRRLGHTVRTTGRVWDGWRLPTTKDDVRRIDAVVDDVLAGGAQVALVVRPAALTPRHVQRLRRRGVLTVAWFADDPVFFKVQSREVAAEYDLTLHTATEPVLELYERELGVRGLGFPFWADRADFPRVYRAERCDVDVVFIGNTHTRVKRWRYDWIAALPVSRLVFGQAKEDTAGIVAGFVEEPAELARAAARGRFGLNISQRFVDYAGSRFDFPGLAELGEFPLPSRVVELAAAGVPVLALVASDRAAADLGVLFPPAVVVRDAEGAAAAVRSRGDAELDALSERTYGWFARHYSADARALFLHRLLADPERFRRQDARTRALGFLECPTPSRVGRARIRLAVAGAEAAGRARTLARRGRASARRRVRRVTRRRTS